MELKTEVVQHNLTFGDAIEAAKRGCKIAREGWNGKGMFVIYVPGHKSIRPVAGTPYSDHGITEDIEILPHFDMYTVNAHGRRAMLPGWLASQTDMDQRDWCIVTTY